MSAVVSTVEPQADDETGSELGSAAGTQDTSLGTLIRRAARYAAQADQTGTMNSSVVESLRLSDLATHFVEPRFGGGNGEFAGLSRSIFEIARACPATAWLASVSAYNARSAGFLPRQARQEIWGDSGTALIASGLVPTGRAEVTGTGDYRLSGTWKYVSGVQFADWVLLVAMTQPAGGPTGPYLFAVPAHQVSIQRTWDSLGMRATGSHSVRVDDLEVPAHRVISYKALLAGTPALDALNDPAHAIPLLALGGLTFLAPALGAAEELVGLLTRRALQQAKAADKPVPESVSLALGRAAAAIDATHHLMAAITSDLDAGLGGANGALNAQRAAYAATLLREALGVLMPVIGTGSLAEHTDVQRLWRDVTVAVSHAALDMTKATTAYIGRFS